MTYTPYHKLPASQQAVIAAMHKDWDENQRNRFEYWVTKRGRVSLKKGHHRLSEAEAAKIDRAMASSTTTGPTPTRDQPRRYTGTPQMHLGSNKD